MITLPERLKDLDEVYAVGLMPCLKKPIPVKARQMNSDFRVQTLEGDYKQGKAGDFLMCGVDDELYICDQRIWIKSYDWFSVDSD